MLFFASALTECRSISITSLSLYLSSRNHMLASALFCKEISLLPQLGVLRGFVFWRGGDLLKQQNKDNQGRF